jgi:hypothetical protein
MRTCAMAIAEARERRGCEGMNRAQPHRARLCAPNLARVRVILCARLRFPQAVDGRVKNFRRSTIAGQTRDEPAKSRVPETVEKIGDACRRIATCLGWILSGGTTTNQRPRKGIAASKEEATSDGEGDSEAARARDFGRAHATAREVTRKRPSPTAGKPPGRRRWQAMSASS